LVSCAVVGAMDSPNYIPQSLEGGSTVTEGEPRFMRGSPVMVSPCLMVISEKGKKREARSLILYTVSWTNKRENAGVR
jgi:hypothetical protein